MKKITFLFLSILFISCGNNKEEQMLYDYQQKNVKALNFDLKDLNFKIQKIDKVADITAADSLKPIRYEFTSMWGGKDYEQSIADTLSFKYVKDFVHRNIVFEDSLVKAYQLDTIFHWSEREINELMEETQDSKDFISEIETIEEKYNKLSESPDSILSTKYRAVYSFNNPLLGNTKQTFEKFYYTNAEQTKFIKEEEVEE